VSGRTGAPAFSPSGKRRLNAHISRRRKARLAMKSSQPEKAWKNPSATFDPKNW
jgi:hypothetical protein